MSQTEEAPARLPANRNAGNKPRVVVLGGGFAGLTFCRQFDSREAELTLVDERNHHLFQPLLYQVATASLSAPDIAQPIRSILSGRQNLTVVMDRVERIDLEGRRVHLGHDAPLDYDYLVLGLGARTTYFGNDHWAEFAPGLKNLNDALLVRNRILEALERAEITEDPEERAMLLTVVFVGGGPTGVELAGATHELARSVLRRDFNHIRNEQVRVVLVEGAGRVLGGFTERSSRRAQEQLEQIGVEVLLGNMVEDIREHEIKVGGRSIRAGSIIWTAGVEAVPVIRELPVAQDKAGRIKVEPDLSVPGYPEVFALGDIIHLTDAKGQPVPGVAQGAMQTGAHAARVVSREIRAKATPGQSGRASFVYNDKGSMATIGRSKAVAEIGKLRFGGFFAWLLWLFIHLLFLIGLRNKIAVVLNWIFQYVTFRSGARVIWGRGLRRPRKAAEPVGESPRAEPAQRS